MIHELYWDSNTSRANVEPETKEVIPINLVEGMVLWFEWDYTNGTLQYREGDRNSKCKTPFDEGGFERRCTTTLLYCEGDGFSSIPYHPFRDPDAWAHWWGLGFQTGGRDTFTIEPDNVTFDRKKIAGNASGWFKLFRGTQHDNSAVVVNRDKPLLTGATSLIWALAAFQFNAGALLKMLPCALKRDGNLHILCGDPPGSMGSNQYEN